MEKIKAFYFLDMYVAKINQHSAYYLEIDSYFNDMLITNKLMLQES